MTSRLKIRLDLPGYAAQHPPISQLNGLDLERPFTLLYGPNGSGKSSLLRMMRRSMLLRSDYVGQAIHLSSELTAISDACGDMGRLAASQATIRHQNEPLAGIVDLAELGWAGQRTYLLDGPNETIRPKLPHFDEDAFLRHLTQIVEAKHLSHGQYLSGPITEALEWALGCTTPEDPFDQPRPKRSRRDGAMF